MSFNWFYLQSPIMAPISSQPSALPVDLNEENGSVGVTMLCTLCAECCAHRVH